MILYHGSNTDIEQVDLKAGIPYKDFGQGFYLTPDIETAKRMAQKPLYKLLKQELPQAA